MLPEQRSLDTKASDSDGEQQRVTKSTLLTFGIAIVLHSFIDGLAIGIFDEADELIVLALGVIIHKIPVSFTVGVTFQSNGQPFKAVSTMAVFALFIISSPLGMLLGMVLQKIETGNALAII